MTVRQLSGIALAFIAVAGCETKQPPPMTAPPPGTAMPAPPPAGSEQMPAPPSSATSMAPSAGSAAMVETSATVEEENSDKARTDIATRCQMYIADEIKAACGIKRDEPHFEFDSAALSPAASKILTKLSDCFKTGALKNRGMLLVGHADARGSSEYNMTLGERRAESVQSYLEAQGLAGGRIETVSRGKKDATGNDETSWAGDRRVDVLLLPSGSSGALARASGEQQ